MSKKESCCRTDLGTGEVKRRSFLGLLLGLCGGVVALAMPIYAAVRAVILPLGQQGLSGKEYFVTTLDSLDETPVKFPIIDDVKDAWVTTPRQIIGNIYVRKNEKGDVLAWQACCPHVGCTIGVKTTENSETKKVETFFSCPCHTANFDLAGKRLDAKPDAPRDMDSLKTRIDKETGKVYVTFQNFAFGVTEKKES